MELRRKITVFCWYAFFLLALGLAHKAQGHETCVEGCEVTNKDEEALHELLTDEVEVVNPEDHFDLPRTPQNAEEIEDEENYDVSSDER